MFGLVGLVIGCFFLIFVPGLKPVTNSLLLFSAFHLVGASIILATLWYGGLRAHFRQKASLSNRLDFGWDPSWTIGLAIAALISAACASLIQTMHPNIWLVAWLFLLSSASLFAGFILMLGYRRTDFAVLPLVNFLSGSKDVVLDAGCGAGRTTIALARALQQGSIVAFDRFDAGYIDGGGRQLIENNLRLAKMSDRVRVETGDLSAMPFPDASFDSVVSTNVYDHLDNKKAAAMNETFRVMKTGGRFLLGLSVPSWAMFAVGHVLSFLLMSRAAWRKLAAQTGFAIEGEWMVNSTWFVLLVKPASAAPAPVNG